MNNRSNHFAPALMLCALLAPIAMAQDAPAIEEVEVLGSKQAERSIIDVDLSTYNGFENIIDRSEFENRLVDIGDIINNSVSAQVRKNSGFGGYSSFSIRGSTGKQVNLYIDGMLLNSPHSGSTSLSSIPTSMLERIEIFPDFTPVQLNDANLGGAINLVTRKPSEKLGGRATLSFGSFNTQQQSLDLFGGNDTTHGIIALSHTKSGNDFPIDRKIICEDGSCGDSKKRENAAYQNYSMLAKVSHEFSQQYSVHVLLGSSKSKNDVPTHNNIKSSDINLENELYQYNVLLQSRGEPLGWGTRLYGNLQKEHYIDKTGRLSFGGGADVKQKQEQIGLNNFFQYDIADHTLGLNIDFSRTQGKTDDLRNPENLKSTRQRLALSLSEQWQIKPNLSWDIALRTQLVDDKSTTNRGISTSSRCDGSTSSCESNKKWHPSWQTGIAWEFVSNWQLKANIGEMIRIPTLRERFGETDAFIGKANLKPEKSTNIDAGFVFDNDYTHAQITFFHKQVNDLIFTFYNSSGVGKPDNMKKATIYGAELLLEQKLGQYFSTYYMGQWMNSENKSGVKEAIDKKIPGFYHQNNQIGFRLKTSKHQAIIYYQHDEQLFYSVNNLRQAKAKKLVNISYTWDFYQFNWNISMNNILNYKYVDFDFMPAPGRSFTTTLSYNF